MEVHKSVALISSGWFFSRLPKSKFCAVNDAFAVAANEPNKELTVLNFNETHYKSQYPEITASIEAGLVANALAHFNSAGFQEGRDPNPHFDTSYYLSQNTDVTAAVINPFDHYNTFGYAEGRSPNAIFDPTYYAEQNPDVVNAGIDLFQHFLVYGAAEGRLPSAAVASQLTNGFDENTYRATHIDVDNAITNGELSSGLQHWLLYGFQEQRASAQNVDGETLSVPGISSVFTLELLHFADQEASAAAVSDAPNLSAVLNALRAQDLGSDGVVDNTLTLSSGDAFIPSLFFDASEAVFGTAGIADIQIQNELGVQAIALGNHEFDFGTSDLAALIDGSATGNFDALSGTSLDGLDFTGTTMPYLSANLDFSTDENMSPLAIAGGLIPQGNKISSSTVVSINGEQIGVVGATTPTLGQISSPGSVGISPTWASVNPTEAELDALAAEIQTDVDALLAANPALNKVILLAHMQQLTIEQALATRLKDVDVIVAGGSNTRLFDDNDVSRSGDSDQGQYPQFFTNAGGSSTAVVNTDGSYKYVGRLVLDFDENGNILTDSYDAAISGAYATDAQGVAALDAGGLIDAEIQAIASAIETQIIATESNVFGVSNVFLNGNRTGVDTATDPDGVRSQETNLGNLTADANLAIAKQIDSTVVASIKNGGGIRASIGETVVPAGGTEAVRNPNEAVVDSNGNTIKAEGGISQNDIQTTLAFNNGLTILTLTKSELVAVLEHGVSDLGGGRFAQVSGIKFSYEPDLAAGSRILNAGIFDSSGNLITELVRDGTISGDTNETFRIVTLDFLASPRFDDDGNFTGGGDGYPYPNFNSDPSVGEVGDSSVIERMNVVTLEQEGVTTGDATFADDGTEQDALAEYLQDNFNTVEQAYNLADTGRDQDTRIQNLNYRDDSVFGGAEIQLARELVGVNANDHMAFFG
ncbi:bifunctional metallophosphatase/5'-nucleotidase [Labrenzia sp. R4_2]|uniref:bifunctional metallophosphatase/5'-nucleotidase n=1 Tax=Labrenzia sp. R4_2 TaxID=2821107 RepID=UPI001AD9FD70|nr:bifunctional metallophosphatase/5'-nucleotidase [Labrenzia sp. R4_2]MBO9420314.1 bifunctional metallophosphatase/5'-nucleotidase [Labrenzia sp. R4_2]